jgi:hypothetical protein
MKWFGFVKKERHGGLHLQLQHWRKRRRCEGLRRDSTTKIPNVRSGGNTRLGYLGSMVPIFNIIVPILTNYILSLFQVSLPSYSRCKHGTRRLS